MAWQDALDALQQRVQQMVEDDRKKIGGMTLGASLRLGLAEMRQAVALDGSIADQTQTPLGMYGTLTPGEVSAARQLDTTPTTTTEDLEKAEGQVVAMQETPTVEQPTVEETRDTSSDQAATTDPVVAAQQQTAASSDLTAVQDRGHER